MAQVPALTPLVNGNTADASQVLGNEESIRTVYNAHDTATGGVHGITAPDAIVSKNASQTLTNKTLTSPAVTGLTGDIVSASTKVTIPTNTVQSVVAAAADGTLVDQDFYISPQYNLTVSGNYSYSSSRAVGYFYRLGTIWRMNFNITGSASNTNQLDITINDVIFKAGVVQSISASNSAVTYGTNGKAINSASYIRLNAGGSAPALWAASGDVELDAKPTAYLPAGV